MTLTSEQEPVQPTLTKAERGARLIGTALDHDREEIAYWQRASEQERGQTLYQLLQFAQDVLNATPPRPAAPLTFPGFPRRRRPSTPPA